MKLSTRLITGALLLSQLTLGLGAFVPPASAQAPQDQAQALAPRPLSNKQKLPRPDSANATLQKASHLHASLTPAQRKSAQEILERYTPQLKELSEQLKAATPSASAHSSQSPEGLVAPDLAQLQEVTGRMRGIQDQIEAEMSSVLSQDQLQQYRAVFKPFQTDTIIIGYPNPCASSAYGGMVYSNYTYLYATHEYYLGGGHQGGNLDAFWAGYNGLLAYNAAYSMYYYNAQQGDYAYHNADQAWLYANAYSQAWNSGSAGDLIAHYAYQARSLLYSARACY